ncbi:MAG: hypothetical protein ABI131_10550 [Nostocoides sp.]
MALYTVFGIGALAILVGLGFGIVNRVRGEKSEPWEDEPADGKLQLCGGPGWGNGGSWN